MKPMVALVALLLISSAFGQVGNKDLEDIRKLVADRKYEEALQKHIWFHDESKKSPAMGGVRLSFALRQWIELGEKYPPALEALRKIRDEDEAMLLGGKGTFKEFHDCSAINRALKEDDRTYTLFKEIDAKDKRLASRCFGVAMDLLIEHGEYELCASHIPDPIRAYEELRQMRELNLSLMKTNPEMKDAAFQNYADKTFKAKTLQLIDLMLHVKKLDEAKEIQKRAMAYHPDDAFKAAVP